MHNYPVILYVEDEENDILLIQLAFARSGLSNTVKIAVNGVEAIDYLAGQGPFFDRDQYPLPSLLLLDLNLPMKSGFDVLEWARRQPGFAHLPIIVYTSSHRDTDRDRARQLGATDYIIKRSDVNEIAELVRGLAGRWLPSGMGARG